MHVDRELERLLPMTKPKYTKKRRSTAGLKGWDTRRKNATTLKQQDYGIDPGIEEAKVDDKIDIGGPLPVEFLNLFGNIAGWEDEVFDVDVDGYHKLHTCFPVVESVGKLGIRTSKLDWTVVGEGERADAIRDIIEQAKSWVDMILWLTWAEVDGVRYMQIKSADARAGGEPWVVPDFWMGGRKKAKAGGSIQWDGGDHLVLEQETTGAADQQSQTLPIEQFIIHRPGAGSNPEGDLDKALALYRIAFLWNEALKNTNAHMELFGIPIRVFKSKVDSLQPDQMQNVLQAAANRIRNLRENKTVSITDEQMLDLIEPKGRGFEDLMKYSQYLEGLIDQMFLGNTLTSKTNEGGRTGNTETHKAEEDEVAFINGVRISEALNRHLLPWIIMKNPALPELKEGEFEPYLAPQNPQTDDEIDIETEEPDGTPDPDTNTGHEDEPEENSAHSTLLPDGTDHSHTVTLDDAGNGTSSTDESEAAGTHSHDVIGGEVQPAGSNDHTHTIGQAPEEPVDEGED